MRQLPRTEYISFDQRQTAIRHLEVLICAAIVNVKQFLISLAYHPDALLRRSTVDAPDTIGFEGETQLFVPVLWLCRNEDKRPAAIAALAHDIEVMGDRNGRP